MKNCVVRPFGFAQDRRAHHILSLWFDLLTAMSGVEWSKDEQRMAKGENNSPFALRRSLRIPAAAHDAITTNGSSNCSMGETP